MSCVGSVVVARLISTCIKLYQLLPTPCCPSLEDCVHKLAKKVNHGGGSKIVVTLSGHTFHPGPAIQDHTG